MKVSGYYDGIIVYDDVFSSFNYGDVYYIDSSYSGVTKQELPDNPTPYLADKRREIIVSSQTFNNNGPWRLTVPLSTYHPNSTNIDGNKILYKDHTGITRVAHLDQMRARHVSDMYKSNNSFMAGHLCEELMKIITEKLIEIVGNEEEKKNLVTEEIQLNTRLNSLESRIEKLERSSNKKRSNNYDHLRPNSEDDAAAPEHADCCASKSNDFEGDIISIIPTNTTSEADTTIVEFAGTCIDFTYNDNDFIEIGTLYREYQTFCEGKGEDPLIIASFSKRLHKLFPNIKRVRKTVNKQLVYTWGPMKFKNETDNHPVEPTPKRKPVNRISKWSSSKIKLFESDLRKLPVSRIVTKYNIDGSTVYKYKKEHGIN